ncbi:hypothetical protein CYFUS_003113 [Cystobacter fuscus]|uniref:Uncharacterized protein n=1 Tax=Cystobacter fuscus TaxID=43 RepID=A0A250J2G5_9BACT|nr:hypothetical protein [Cystobacter fuscus]ATB37688.1 hypothetical protein CYFUS_003113 [Cystobacter fuscus]
MDLSAFSNLSPRHRRMLSLAGLIAIPTYVLPVSFWGLRGLRPRLLRDAVSGAITLGLVSLVVRGVRPLTRRGSGVKSAPSNGQRWQLPIHEPILPEEMMGSQASGH